MLAQYKKRMADVALNVGQGLKAVMLTGHAAVAQEFMENVKQVETFQDFRIVRTNGMEAFQDNATIDDVNDYRGKDQFKQRLINQEIPIYPSDHPYLEKTIHSSEPLVFQHINADGERVLTYLATLENSPECHRCHGGHNPLRGLFKLTTSLEPAFAKVLSTRNRAWGIMTLFLGLIMGLVGLLLSRTVIKPIHHLTFAISRVTEGDLSKRVPVLGCDELANMTHHFNTMIGRVEVSHTHMQEEIQKRKQVEHTLELHNQHLEQEIQKRKEVECKLEEHNQHLDYLVTERTKLLIHAERLASLGTFSAGMAHEINNPNSFISGNIQFLQQFWQLAKPIVENHKKEDTTGRISRFMGEFEPTLEGILDGSQRISKIVDSLKAYSKGGMNTDKVDCRLMEPVNDASNLLRHKLKMGTTFQTDIPKNIMVHGDRQQISQVFVNLINNAMEAMENAGMETGKEIHVRSEVIDRHVWIWVKDNGPGISPESSGKIFDPFYTSKGKTKGTGLGLSIVQGIIEDHRGQITVFSKENEGAEFLIILPSLALWYEKMSQEKRDR